MCHGISRTNNCKADRYLLYHAKKRSPGYGIYTETESLPFSGDTEWRVLPSDGPATKPDLTMGRGEKFLSVWTVLPTNSVVWVHNPAQYKKAWDIGLSRLGLAVPPSGWRKKMQTTSGRTQLSSSNSWYTKYILNLKMLKYGKYIIWNQWNMVADK